MGKYWVWNVCGGRAYVVDEGSRAHCEARAAQGNAASARLGTAIRFEALPEGQEPGPPAPDALESMPGA